MLSGIEKIYSSAMRIAASAFIQDPLTLDVVVNAPALTQQGIVIARDRLRHLSRTAIFGGQRSCGSGSAIEPGQPAKVPN